MPWWKLAEPWVTPIAAIVALLLSVGNTTKLVIEARREHAERKWAKERAEQAERELSEIVDKLTAVIGRAGLSGAMTILPDCGYELGAKLGVERGTLRGEWHLGHLVVRLATLSDPK